MLMQDELVNLDEELSLDTIKEIETDENQENSRTGTRKNLLRPSDMPDFEYNSQAESVLTPIQGLPQDDGEYFQPEIISIRKPNGNHHRVEKSFGDPDFIVSNGS